MKQYAGNDKRFQCCPEPRSAGGDRSQSFTVTSCRGHDATCRLQLFLFFVLAGWMLLGSPCTLVVAQVSGSRFFSTREDAKQLPLPKEEDVFQFAIFGDRTSGVPAGLKVLEQAVVDTNLLAPDLVMTVGDLIQGYNQTPQWLEQKDEYRAIMERLNMDWFPVAGNHDVYWQRADSDKPQGEHERNYETHFGPLWYSFKHKNAGFLVLFSDEGNPDTNEKGFNNPELQMMSPKQLAFVKEALEQLKTQQHVFVFLHHPRWIGGNYEGSNWEEVHQLLAAAGNVSAVFAGHIHHMRYDGKRDGIEYYALAATGGNLSADFPEAGYLHHFNMVTVHEDRIQVATLPVGSVIDPKKFTQDYLRDLEILRGLTATTLSPLPLNADGSVDGVLQLEYTNPAEHPIDLALTAIVDDTWRVFPDHQHKVLAAGETLQVEFRFRRDVETWGESGGMSNFQAPMIQSEVDLLREDVRLRVPGRMMSASLRLGEVPTDYFSGAVPKAFSYRRASERDEAGIRVDHESYRLPQGPFTLEAWVNSSSNDGSQGIVTKTQSSEYGLFANDGRVAFSVHLDGSYVTVRGRDPLPLGRWVHVAGVYDGEQVRLYVDGQQVAVKAGSGERKENRLPLYLGADPDGKGLATRPFDGALDEVRLSVGARYSGAFAPAARFEPDPDTVWLFHLDQQIGPFAPDHGPARLLGRRVKERGEWVEGR